MADTLWLWFIRPWAELLSIFSGLLVLGAFCLVLFLAAALGDAISEKLSAWRKGS